LTKSETRKPMYVYMPLWDVLYEFTVRVWNNCQQPHGYPRYISLLPSQPTQGTCVYEYKLKTSEDIPRILCILYYQLLHNNSDQDNGFFLFRINL